MCTEKIQKDYTTWKTQNWREISVGTLAPGFRKTYFLSFKETGFERVIWINLAQDMVDWL